MKESPRQPEIDYAAVAQTGLFKTLAARDLEAICREGRLRFVAKNAPFFLQGDPADRIYLLVTGQMKLTQTNPDGQQILMRAIGPYTLFGAVAMTQQETYPVTAETLEDCYALAWTKPVMMALVGRFPQLAINAIQLMAQSTQEFQERFRQLATERVERRLAHTLLRLAGQTGKKIPEGVWIDLPLTRQDLAEMTGTTLFTVSRLLTQWEKQGLIIADRERIVIRYPHGLVSIAED
jgi:CRP/FNR family transcriptional regulator, nitrogen oxide reductase regulator